MKNNDERIIKYLSDLMDADEKAAFEAELNSSASLKSEFESITGLLGEFKLNNIEADERYFANLLPNVRTKLEKKPKLFSITKIAYSVPTIIVVMLIGLFMFKGKSPDQISSGTLIQEIVKNIDDENVSKKYLTELELDVNHAYDLAEENTAPQTLDLDEAAKQKILTLYDNPITEESSTTQNLSEDELKTIYKKISIKNTY